MGSRTSRVMEPLGLWNHLVYINSRVLELALGYGNSWIVDSVKLWNQWVPETIKNSEIQGPRTSSVQNQSPETISPLKGVC